MARRSDPGQNPTLRGRRLAVELMRRRDSAGLSREEVARQLEWSTSTVFRIETGRSRPQPGNVRVLLDLYGVTGAERDGLIQLAREARQPGHAALGRSPCEQAELNIELVLGTEPTPEFAALVADECRRLLDRLGDPQLQSIALWKMEGYTNAEIANCSHASVINHQLHDFALA